MNLLSLQNWALRCLKAPLVRQGNDDSSQPSLHFETQTSSFETHGFPSSFKSTKKILVVSYDALGDFFLSLPAFNALQLFLKQQSPQLEIHLLCSPRNFSLATQKAAGSWDRVFPMFLNGDLRDLPELAGKLEFSYGPKLSFSESWGLRLLPSGKISQDLVATFREVFRQEYDLVLNFFDEPDLRAQVLLKWLGRGRLISLRTRQKEKKDLKFREAFESQCLQVVDPSKVLAGQYLDHVRRCFPEAPCTHFQIRTFALVQWLQGSRVLSFKNELNRWQELWSRSFAPKKSHQAGEMKILFHPFGSHRGNRFSDDKAIEILIQLQKHGRVYLLSPTADVLKEKLKTAQEKGIFQILPESLPKVELGLSAADSIESLFGQISQMDLVITTLTSIFHFSVALGVPTLGLRQSDFLHDEFLPLLDSHSVRILGKELSSLDAIPVLEISKVMENWPRPVSTV